MKLPVARLAAAMPLAFAIAAPSAFANPEIPDTVVVTATRTPQRAGEVIADTTVIHAEEIARSGAGSVADLLQRQRGVEISRNGSGGAATNVFLRGANSNQVVVLIDGVRIGSSTSGVASWNAIPLDAIVRIEVVYGPLSTLYGADAIGGVIQIFTRKGQGGAVARASIGAGSNGTHKVDANALGRAGSLSYAIGAGHEESDGFSATRRGSGSYNPDEDGYRRRSINGRLAMAIAPGHEIGAQFLLSRLRNQFDNGAGAYDAHSDQDLNTVAAFMSNQILQGWRSTVQLARSDDKQDSFTSSLPAGASQIDTRQDELTWQNTLALGRDTLQLLYSHREEEVTSGSTRALSRDRITNSYAAAYSARRGQHLVDLSARQDRSVYGNKNTGAVGYGYDFGRGLRATGSIGTSFRAPTFNELYYPGFGLESNKPEKGRNRELGLRYDGSRVQADASWYRNRLTDMIVSASPCPGGRPGSCAYNVNEALLEGVSVGASTHLAGLRLRGSIDWQDPRDETTGKRLTRRSKEHASFAAEYTVGRVKTGAEWQLSGRRFDDAANLRPLGGYGLVNLYTTWQFTSELSLLVRVNNLADKQYELARNYGTAGRNWFAALRYGIR